MKTENYNQYSSPTTKNSCSIVSFFNIFKYKYAIIVYNNFFIGFSIYLDKLGLFNIKEWWIFSIVDNAIVNTINKKLDLDFKLVTKSLNSLKESDQGIYQLWVKWYSTKKFNTIKADWKITLAEMDYLKTFTGWIWHAVTWGKWYFIDTDWGKNTKMSLEVLKYGVKLWLFWNTIRTIEPNDRITKKVCELTIRLFQAEKKGRLDEYLDMNKENPYLDKSRQLYFYGR